MYKLNLLIFCLCTLFACNNSNTETTTENSEAGTEENAQKNLDATPDKLTNTEEYCFLSTYGENPQRQDSTFVNLTISGIKVTGEMHWHPFEKDGGHGTLSGVREGNLIKVRYDYMIEGANQSEDMEFLLEPSKLIKKVGELEEDGNGHFTLKDPKAAEFKEELKRVVCTDRELH